MKCNTAHTHNATQQHTATRHAATQHTHRAQADLIAPFVSKKTLLRHRCKRWIWTLPLGTEPTGNRDIAREAHVVETWVTPLRDSASPFSLSSHTPARQVAQPTGQRNEQGKAGIWKFVMCDCGNNWPQWKRCKNSDSSEGRREAQPWWSAFVGRSTIWENSLLNLW